jgi:prefoldin subunit 5
MDYLFTSNITDPAILAAEVERLRAEAERLIAEVSRLTKLLDEIEQLKAENSQLRKIASSLTAAADEAERLFGDVAAYGLARVDKESVRTLLSEAITRAKEERGR